MKQQRLVLITKDMLNTGDKSPVYKVGLPHFPCHYYGSTEHRSSVCSQMMMYLTFMTKILSPYYICSLLLQSVVEQAQGQKSYHSDDPSCRHIM